MADTPKPSTLSAATGRWRDRLLDAAVITIPTALVTQSVGWIQGKFFAENWQILWIAIPLAVCAFIAWKLLRRPEARRIDWRFSVFLAIFASLFSIASATELLVWKRVPLAEFRDDQGTNWLLPVTLGDWRYWLLRDAAVPRNLTVLLIDHHADQSPAMKRIFDAQILHAAARDRASGVFFDIAFPRASATDQILCDRVAEAVARNVSVVTAYALEPVPGTPAYAPDPKQTAGTPPCLLEGDGRSVYRSHSMVFADVDGRVRSLPVDWAAAPGEVPFSLRIARLMAAKPGLEGVQLPDAKLLRFAHADTVPITIAGDEAIMRFISTDGALARRFLVVGELSKADSFKTPWSAETPGVLLHVYAASSMLGRPIVKPPAWFSAFIVVAACLILALFASQGATAGQLSLIAAATMVGVIALAAIAIAMFNVWVDVIYAGAALCLLLPLLLAYRKLVR